MKQADILRRARDYLDQIAWGKDPLTGQELPTNTVLRDKTVLETLRRAASDLERIVIYDSGRERPPYAPDPARRQQVSATEQTISRREMLARLGRTCDRIEVRTVEPRTLMDYLADRGFIQLEGQSYSLTPEGSRIGLVSGTGERVRFTTQAQQFLLDNLDDLADFCAASCPEAKKPHAWERIGEAGARQVIQDDLRILQCLSQGLCPGTGEPLPPSDPACQKRLKTCFDYGARALERALELGIYSAQVPFSLTRAEWEGIPVPNEPCTGAEFCRRVNGRLPDQTAVKGMTAPKLTERLLEAGLLEKDAENQSRPTAQGAALGIELRDVPDKDYKQLVYSPAAQRHLKSLLESYIREDQPRGQEAEDEKQPDLDPHWRSFYRYLYDCHNELAAYLGDPPDLDKARALGRLNYGEGQAQDYRDPLVQRLYALRYMYAYGVEYYRMFCRLFDALGLEPGKRTVFPVLSLGCGNGIDLWAAKKAMADRGLTAMLVRYTGVDRVAWDKRWGVGPCLPNRFVRYVQGDAAEFLEQHLVLDCKAIVFPRSIGEFSDGDFARICRALSEARFAFTWKGSMYDRREVHILVTLRKTGDISPVDQARCERLIGAMEANGYVLKDPEVARFHTLDGGAPINRYTPQNITYPNWVSSFWEEVSDQLGEDIRLIPVLTTQYFCNRVMTFVRRDRG